MEIPKTCGLSFRALKKPILGVTGDGFSRLRDELGSTGNSPLFLASHTCVTAGRLESHAQSRLEHVERLKTYV